jgi:superfamily I DNA/RNA helicase
MKERIGKMIGDGLEAKLVLGTFHSIARRYLVKSICLGLRKFLEMVLTAYTGTLWTSDWHR